MLDIHHRNIRNIFPLGVRISVSNLERSHKWYKDALGLHMDMSDDETYSVHQIEMADGTKAPVFWLIPDRDTTIEPMGINLVCHVGQMAQIVKDLRSAGVTIVSEPVLRPGTAIPSAIIEDPDGHKIYLYGN